ncbi:type VI secretion system baseplate subunit TssE [Sulfidibacter corallicola]|uniref:Type VI secretion system baseplate subunit TssE n=1 Tax=Sulfidibacter corallicola TaxID=2818388 RepID=A0A8A4TPY4_SULCO|nr:type VI secretion system baseplate subunit TssE [Sulfidibacter corallicola]QTD50971.1 type VI secretion system baseplate subunit TssE [Sulfidibacter corallicola]
MDSLKPQSGVPAPLFTRLFDHEPERRDEPIPLRTLDRAGLLDSIRAELMALLQTRVGLPIEQWLSLEKTVLHFGLPDMLHLCTTSKADRELVAHIVHEAILAFEPRLREPRVLPRSREFRTGRFHFELRALMPMGTVVEPVSFPLYLQL